MQMTFRQQICGMAATELVEANRTKQLSPVEVVDAHLEQMEILEHFYR
jgi:aspartyl-tRNA(Asn)/glutamyl-tRNA(Gln) amidotransferase subunit A